MVHSFGITAGGTTANFTKTCATAPASSNGAMENLRRVGSKKTCARARVSSGTQMAKSNAGIGIMTSNMA